MGLFDLFNKKKQERARKAEWEALNNKKDEAMRAYKSSRPPYVNVIGTENCNFDEVGKQFHVVTANKKYGSFLDCLDRINRPDGTELFVLKSMPEGTTDKSKLMIRLPDGKVSDRIFDYLVVEPSFMGAWQAYLLHSVWHSLPLFDHANYEKRTFIFSESDLRSIKRDGLRIEDVINSFPVLDCSPNVRENDGKFYVSSLYWSDFGGLTREFVEITFEDNKVSSFLEFSSDVIYRYDCGIRF